MNSSENFEYQGIQIDKQTREVDQQTREVRRSRYAETEIISKFRLRLNSSTGSTLHGCTGFLTVSLLVEFTDGSASTVIVNNAYLN